MKKSDIKDARKTMVDAMTRIADANGRLKEASRTEALLRNTAAQARIQRNNAEKEIAENMPRYVISRSSLEHVGAL